MKIENNDRLKELNKLLEEWHLSKEEKAIEHMAKEQRKMTEAISVFCVGEKINKNNLEVVEKIHKKYKEYFSSREYIKPNEESESIYIEFTNGNNILFIFLRGEEFEVTVKRLEDFRRICESTFKKCSTEYLFDVIDTIFKRFIKEETTKTKQKQKEEFSLRFPEMGDSIYQIYSDGSIFKTTYDDSFKHVFKQGNAIDSEAQAELESKRRDLMTRFKQFRYLCNEKVTTATPESVLYYIYKDEEGVLRYSYDYQNMNEYRMFGSFLEEKDIKRAREIFGKEILELF